MGWIVFLLWVCAVSFSTLAGYWLWLVTRPDEDEWSLIRDRQRVSDALNARTYR